VVIVEYRAFSTIKRPHFMDDKMIKMSLKYLLPAAPANNYGIRRMEPLHGTGHYIGSREGGGESGRPQAKVL
jgi:hypothetical protein